MKVEITKAQLQSIMSMADDLSSMIGVADDDAIWRRYVRNVDRFLEKNGFKREFL